MRELSDVCTDVPEGRGAAISAVRLHWYQPSVVEHCHSKVRLKICQDLAADSSLDWMSRIQMLAELVQVGRKPIGVPWKMRDNVLIGEIRSRR